MTPTIPIRRLISEVYPRFPRAFTMGTYNRRKIAGSNTWSQHSWANAEDIGVPTLTDGDAVFAWLKLNATRLGLRRFGLRRRPALWRVRNHFDHLHVEGRPKKKGIPPLPGTIPQEEDMLRAGDDTSADPGRGAVGRLQDLLKSAGFPAGFTDGRYGFTNRGGGIDPGETGHAVGLAQAHIGFKVDASVCTNELFSILAAMDQVGKHH